MNLYLHGIAVDADACPIRSGIDSLASDPAERVSLVLTDPPFGKKSSISIVNEDAKLENDDSTCERTGFWVTTRNKQLNFLQHVNTMLKINGRCAVVVPDNVLFEGGVGETVRRNLLKQSDVHTLPRERGRVGLRFVVVRSVPLGGAGFARGCGGARPIARQWGRWYRQGC